MKIIVYSIHNFEIPFIDKAFANFKIEYREERLTPETTHLAEGFNGVSVFSSDIVNDEVLKNLKDLNIKYISTRSVGYDHIDLNAAQDIDIKIANVPEYSPYSVAEFTVAMLLALNRKLFRADELFQLQDFRLDSLVGFDVHNKTIGIIGAGKIGSAFASIMYGFGAKILIYDIEKNPKLEQLENLKYVELDELYENSDIISLSLPLNKHSKYMINNQSIAKMKKKPMLLNTARGGIVNTTDLIYALKSGQISSAALDVFEREKGMYFYDWSEKIIDDDEFNVLKAMQNVYLTSHQAFLTKEALEGIAGTSAQNFKEWLESGKCQNELYPWE
jgi:D-lactate dehydrogenase